MLASALWLVALVVEYQYDLRPPGNDGAAYKADQAAFYVAQVGYLLMLIGLYGSRAGGSGRFGSVGIGIWVIAAAAVVLGQILSVLGVNAFFLLPVSGLGQTLGSLLTSVAVWRARHWTGWRRLAPAIWTIYFFFMIGSVIASIPVVSIPAEAPNPSAPSPLAEAVWQGAWFLLSLALFIEAGRTPEPQVAPSGASTTPAHHGRRDPKRKRGR
jgi:hypothetical protein